MTIVPEEIDAEVLGSVDSEHAIPAEESIDYLLEKTGMMNPDIANLEKGFHGRDILPKPVEEQVLFANYLSHAERAALARPEKFYSRS
ncbi:hypothetical protein KY328_05185 [Candidatus Woesearchaeota archaeon]|nr:hypothetical protein [Candidatus Woesearchaeota archaeon]MBW3022292.1 hypothetical protein [Candidatus Woesearchaeota archaeon]